MYIVTGNKTSEIVLVRVCAIIIIGALNLTPQDSLTIGEVSHHGLIPV